MWNGDCTPVRGTAAGVRVRAPKAPMICEMPTIRGTRVGLVAAAVWLAAVGAACGSESEAPGDGENRDASVADRDGSFGGGDASSADAGRSDTSALDAGSDTTSIADSGPSTDSSADVYAVPNRCSEEYRTLINASGPAPKVRRVPWKMLAGGSPSYRKKTITALWKGTRELESTVQFDCPPNAESTGLDCQTDRGLVLQHTASGSAKTMVFAVSIPVGRIDFPEQGTEVRLTYYSGDRFGAFQIQRSGDRAPILALRAAESDTGPNGKRTNPERFSNDYGLFEVAMQADIDRADTAHCLAIDHCDRLLRVEPLSLVAEKTLRTSPGRSQRFQASNFTYRFWHLVSFRRNQMLGPESSCADVTYPAAAYAFARLK